MSGGSRVVVGRLQQRPWTAENGSARQVVEVVTEELRASLRWATATTTRTTWSSRPAPPKSAGGPGRRGVIHSSPQPDRVNSTDRVNSIRPCLRDELVDAATELVDAATVL